ncbi:hypothetical protein [Kitasatospora sp. HPMI-4]|uniref:hypothetical protein n=1 Tax=Kitasatospora sp. HPMI-4 TaxID=3448443 RepID=UPI003F1B5707
MFGADEYDLKLQGPLLVGGQIVTCPACGSESLALTKQLVREVWPARLHCLSCYHAEDHPVITNGLVDAALAARTGRQRAEDRDTFAAEWRGIMISGACVPEFVLDDAVAAGQELLKEGKKEFRQRRAEVEKQARTWWGGKKKQARDGVDQAVGAAKAGVLGAAWQMQTGGAGPAPKPRSRRCQVKGCRGGWVTIETRTHVGGRKQKVPCAACHRA